MTGRLGRKVAVKTLGHQGLFALATGERNKVKRFAVKRSRKGGRYRMDHALELSRRHGHFAKRRIAYAVGRLGYTDIANDLLRGPRRCVYCVAHGIILA